jgi:GNAT superfamily N-acetyltransferase
MPLTIREATRDDMPALVELHLITWRATYEGILTEKELSVPTQQVRYQQWLNAFANKDGSWFCYVVDENGSRLVGFAVGRRSRLAGFEGELHKIYLLREYQGKGFGRVLLDRVVKRFLSQGIKSMMLYADARNPSVGFYTAMGGEKLSADPNDGNYGWKDLMSAVPLSSKST